MDTSDIDLVNVKPDLYDRIADEKAKIISNTKKEVNKPTQLRRFYNEVLAWDQRIRQERDKYDEFLPLIRMVNAKVAYAQGRGPVDKNFAKLMSRCLEQLKPGEPETFHHMKLFMEAFNGFYKLYKND